MQWWLLIAFYIVASSPVSAGALLCAGTHIRVEATHEEIARRACRSINAARDSLSRCGVRVPEPLEITVVYTIDAVNGSCLGLYHCGRGQIEILSPTAMAAKRSRVGAFAGISDEAMWDSVFVHELTHAAYERVDCPFESCIATEEYAAHVMQIRSLPPDEQARFGENVVLKGTASNASISAFMYFMAPERFAKYAWLHFQSQPNSCDYMQSIMDGEVVFDRERP